MKNKQKPKRKPAPAKKTKPKPKTSSFGVQVIHGKPGTVTVILPRQTGNGCVQRGPDLKKAK